MKAIISIILIAISFFKIDIVFTGQPLWQLWGSPTYIQYKPEKHYWLNFNTQIEYWRLNSRQDRLPEKIPERKTFEIKLNTFFQRKNDPLADLQAAMAFAIVKPNKKIKLINVEQSINEARSEKIESRIWPHLGLLYIGTVADQEGWDVELYDELVQGYVDIEKFIQPGDLLGLSLVITGIERGVKLAQKAKELGASYVIAGNDSAIFRANQLLSLPGHPIDAVFTTNSLAPIRQFLRHIDQTEISAIKLAGIATAPSQINLSNSKSAILNERDLTRQLKQQGRFDSQDVFIVPKLNLYSDEYWQKIWQNYRQIFGQKHSNPSKVRNAIALFAQGCTRSNGADVCSYCSINGVADIRMPEIQYLQQTLETYQSFGINYVFNATDSAFEMRRVSMLLKRLGAFFSEGLMLYGRAWGVAHYPELIDQWLSLTGGRLLINVGMDSGDEKILATGINKLSRPGSRLDENRQAVKNIASSGTHLHFSLIFGSPGETKESCEKTLEFFDWTRATLGLQLDQCESDIYWLTHGSPASRVFTDYAYAQQLAKLTDNEISAKCWENQFYRYRDTLVVPWECEESWYRYFTRIKIEDAQNYNAVIVKAMAKHEGAAPGRDFMHRAFRPI